jgi:DNA polymerase-3 subunit beta
MVATDGSRLSYAQAPYTDGEVKLGRRTLLSPKGLEEVCRVLDCGDTWKVTLSDRAATFHTPGMTVVARHIEGEFPDYQQAIGEFPDYQQAIPKTSPKAVKVGRAAFDSAVRRISLFATDRAHTCRFAFGAGGLVMTASSDNFGDGREEVACDLTGEPITVSMNLEYVRDVLGCTSGDLSIGLDGVLDPVVVKVDGQDFLGIIMPMRYT